MPEPSSPDDRPFLPFVNGPKNKLRKKVRGGGVKPRESEAAHGQNILRQIEAFQAAIDAQEATRSPDLPRLPDEIQAIVEAKKLPIDRVTSLGLTPIEERADGLLVTVTPTPTLPTLADKTQAYISERTDSDNPRYQGVIAPIDNIRPATREDKIGVRLAEWIADGKLRPDELLWVDIELAGGQADLGQQNRQQFYDYIHGLDAWLPAYAEHVITATSHFVIEADYSLHRVLLPAQAIEDLLDSSRASWLLLIDLIPEIEDRTMPLPEVAAGSLPQLPELADDAPRIVIVDSGIAADHPLFSDGNGRTIIGRQMNFLPQSVEPADLTADEVEQGHGTAIASVAAYGSLREAVLDQQDASPGLPVFWIENAKVMLPASKLDAETPASQPQLHPTQIPKVLMRQVIEEFHQSMPRQCKVFTLSVGSAPYHRQSMSSWAEELDNLSAYNDLLFIVSAGTLFPAAISARLAEGQEYPAYLLDPQTRLRNPAQARSALTVGALTGSRLTPLFQGSRSQPPAGHPAPFTRSGLLHDTIVKPEVVETGGSLNFDNLSAESPAAPEASVLVANGDFTSAPDQQPLGFHLGTGLAAARVTHLAGRIQARYPQAAANLIRALIVNSAEWPQPFLEKLAADAGGSLSKEAGQMLLRLCGYGRPRSDRALSSNTHCLVFVTEDEFTWVKEEMNTARRYPAKVSFFVIPFEPDDLFRLPADTQVRVSITMAYNPPVRKTQRRHYQAVQMRWDLKRQEESTEEFQARWLAEAETTDDEESDGPPPPHARPWPWQLKPLLNPGGRVRRGTVIRDWFDVSIHELPSTLEVVTLATVAPWQRPPQPLRQRFALVVSVESLDPAVPLYDVLRVRSQANPDRTSS